MPSAAKSKKLGSSPDGFDFGAVSAPRGGVLYLGMFAQKQIPFRVIRLGRYCGRAMQKYF